MASYATYSIRDMCDRLRLSRRQFIVIAKRIPGRVRLGFSVRYRRDVVDRWIADGRRLRPIEDA